MQNQQPGRKKSKQRPLLENLKRKKLNGSDKQKFKSKQRIRHFWPNFKRLFKLARRWRPLRLKIES